MLGRVEKGDSGLSQILSPGQDLEPISFLPFGSSYLRYGQASEALSKSLCGSGHCIRELDKSDADILQP